MQIITKAEFRTGTPQKTKVTPPGTRCRPRDLDITEAEVARYVQAGLISVVEETAAAPELAKEVERSAAS